MSIINAGAGFGGPLRFFVERSFRRGAFQIFAVIDNPDGSIEAARNIEFAHVGEGLHIGEPLLSLSDGPAQMLMNELWHAGLRPSSGEGNVGQLGATETHLKDMRAIAFGALKARGITTDGSPT